VAAASCMMTFAKSDMQLRLWSWWASDKNLAPTSVLSALQLEFSCFLSLAC
jgi:hypothetical protein